MLKITHLSKRYGSLQALDSLSFDVGAHELVGFVGANGAGKSTTMRIIMGVLEGDGRTVTWNGAPVDAAARRRIGYMPEERGLYPKMKVIDQLVYLAQLHDMEATEARSYGLELLERLQLKGEPTDSLESLSLGNQQRVQIAAALIHRPAALILDEPFSGLDPESVDTTVQVLREYAAGGSPVLFSSHQLDVVERLCDRLVIIRDGEIRADGTRAELLAADAADEWEIETSGDTGWVRDCGVEVQEFDGGYARFRADDPGRANQVLAAALARGTVTSFHRVTRTLHDIYKETTK